VAARETGQPFRILITINERLHENETATRRDVLGNPEHVRHLRVRRHVL
jgi:hypothetical protein